MTAKELLERAPIERTEAEMLLAHVLGVQRAWLFSHGDEGLAPDDADAFMVHARARATVNRLLTSWVIATFGHCA